jgi:hypothetical protein
MKIFGHPWIHSEKFYPISSINEIEKTPPNSTLRLNPLSFSLELAHYCNQNGIAYVLEVKTIKDAIFANQMGCKYIVTKKSLAKEIMPIAQHYLFDTQVLAEIKDESEIEEIAKEGIDGVIFAKVTQ